MKDLKAKDIMNTEVLSVRDDMTGSGVRPIF